MSNQNSPAIDETELASQIAKAIILEIEKFVDNHLKKYQKYLLNAPTELQGIDPPGSDFFTLISTLKDVSVLGRKLLESAPQFNSAHTKSHSKASTSSSSPRIIKEPSSPSSSIGSSGDRRSTLSSIRSSASIKQGNNNLRSDDDATSDDLLAALIESSSSDDFLVLSSSLDSITIKEMMLAALIYIKSHECFTLSHDIQGVVMVLRRVKFIILNILAPKNQMELITKLLTSISRYSEMNYVFDLFRDRNQFEMLLSKGVEKTPELRIALFNYVKKNPEFYDLVTLNFSMFREIAESLEASAVKRLDRLISMNKKKKKKQKKGGQTRRGGDSGDNFSSVANPGSSSGKRDQEATNTGATSNSNAAATATLVASISCGDELSLSLSSSQIGATIETGAVGLTSLLSSSSSSSVAVAVAAAGQVTNTAATGSTDEDKIQMYSKESLNLSLVELVDASDCFAKAGCYKRSNYCEQKAKLIALQLALLTEGINVLGLAQSELNDLIVGFESFGDAYIVAEAYNYHLAWRQALFKNVIQRCQSAYLEQYCKKCDLSTVLVQELVLLYKQYLNNHNNQLSHEENLKIANGLKILLIKLKDVELKCKIYSQLNFDEEKENLLKNAAIQAHLKDVKLA